MFPITIKEAYLNYRLLEKNQANKLKQRFLGNSIEISLFQQGIAHVPLWLMELALEIVSQKTGCISRSSIAVEQHIAVQWILSVINIGLVNQDAFILK